jgi:NAD(P)-dependent dehydrogenase (short-subunit alcohol dehydrogenase family)
MLLGNRVAVITGGSTGMGRGIALKFAEEGCSIIIADINESEAQKTLNDVSKKGKGAIFAPCDVTNNRQIQDMVNNAISKFGKIDILVNNAGGVAGPEGALNDITEEQWNQSLDLNLKSVFLCCKATVPYMKDKKYGKIINISSMGAVNPAISVVHYHAAKAGVIGLTYNLAFELAPFNIAVNVIIPGPIQTPFWNNVAKGMVDKAPLFAEVAKKVPMLRVGTPEDIAGAALFLASELSSYVTGQSLYVAGGQPLMTVSAPPIN